MTFDALLTIALDVAFFAIFAFTLVDYIRNRDRVRQVIMLVFASLVIVLAAAPVRAAVPVLGQILSFLTLPALLAQPLLVLWLASFVRSIPRPALLGSAVAFFLLTGAIMVLVATGGAGGTSGQVGRSPALIVIALGLVAYFLALETAASVAFGLAARARAGA